MKACKCTSGLGNTGTSCSPLMAVQKKLIIVPLFDSTGARNKISFTDVFNDAYFSALINQSDVSKRWFPTGDLKNITDERGEPIMETFEDGSNIPIQQGVRKFTGLYVKAPIQLLGNLESFPCQEIGCYIIDKDGNLIGTIGTQDECDPSYLYPIRIDEGSWYASFEKTTDKKASKIKIEFNFHMDEQDANLRLITQDEHGSDLADIEGLIDVCVDWTTTAHSVTTVTAKLKTFYGTPINPVLDKGLLQTDFALYNTTTSASVTISSMTESPSGVYKFTFSAQNNGDKLRLTPTKTGRDYTLVIANLVQLPLS